MSMDNAPLSPGSRPRPRSRGFSFKSDQSSGSRPKEHLSDSPDEKRRRDSIWKSQSKANPNAAINEVQPGDAQLLEQATIEPLRNVQHKDIYGNPITDPDLSNPTRPRLERPLDTIRSFEKAIDSGYKRRSSMMRGESYEANNQFQSRRNSSHFGGYDNGPMPNRYARNGNANGGGYYGNGGRPDSYVEGAPPAQRQRYGNRMPPDMTGTRANGANGVYPQHGYHQSHDTVMTGGSDSTGPWGNSTDPSSENSSLDRINATSKPQQDGYGANNSYSQGNGYPRPIPEDGAYPQQNGYGGPVQPPGGVRRPIPLGNTADSAAPPRSSLPTTSRPEPEKKKGWLSRKFSKKG